MNHIVIDAITDLAIIKKKPLYLSAPFLNYDTEISENLWGITLGDKYLHPDTHELLQAMIQQIIKHRYHEIEARYPSKKATLYVWFDMQALQLRLNVISGWHDENSLPFGCKVDRENALDSILDNFLKISQSFFLDDDELIYVDIDDPEEDDPKNFRLPIYIQHLGSANEDDQLCQN